MNSVVWKWQKRFVKWFCAVMVTDLMWIIGLQGWNHHWRVLFNFFWDGSLWNWLTEKRLNLEIRICEQEIRFVRRRMTTLIHFQNTNKNEITNKTYFKQFISVYKVERTIVKKYDVFIFVPMTIWIFLRLNYCKLKLIVDIEIFVE